MGRYTYTLDIRMHMNIATCTYSSVHVCFHLIMLVIAYGLRQIQPAKTIQSAGRAGVVQCNMYTTYLVGRENYPGVL